MPDRTSPDHGPVSRLLSEDHALLDGLLERAVREPRAVELEAYGEFRARLLRHIALEEKILFPAIRAARQGEHHPDWVRLRIDHGAITSLLVPPPTPALVGELRSILVPHNGVEEAPGGIYDAADRLLGAAAGGGRAADA